MKALKVMLLLAVLTLSGFSGDSQGPDKGVTLPFKFDGVIITNPSSGLTVCTPPADPSKGIPLITHARTGWLQGNQSHGGRLITELSTWVISDCNTSFSNGINTSHITGENTVANGDSYFYTCIMEVNIYSTDVLLYITVSGGTGRFENATGFATLTGVRTESGIPVNGWGFLILPK